MLSYIFIFKNLHEFEQNLTLHHFHNDVLLLFTFFFMFVVIVSEIVDFQKVQFFF